MEKVIAVGVGQYVGNSGGSVVVAEIKSEIPKMSFITKHISITINKPVNEVYQFIVNAENLSKWATGLGGSSIRKINEEWIADSPMGLIKIKFADKNEFGVLDHTITLPNSSKFYVPMRVVSNDGASELIFTSFKLTDMSAEQFENDNNIVKADLEKLKEILENG
ncbi:MAG: hypothetical protein QM610_07605 [Chitinophagaceae bacterium]